MRALHYKSKRDREREREAALELKTRQRVDVWDPKGNRDRWPEGLEDEGGGEGERWLLLSHEYVTHT